MPQNFPAETVLRPRVAYLGPQGTFSEEALLRSARSDEVEPAAHESIYDAVMSVQRGDCEFALVPIENSLEGSVTITLDTLAGEEADLAIVAESVLAVRHCLITVPEADLAEIETVISHPHVPGQCTGFLRHELADARVLAASSTADAVQQVAERGDRTWAAIGTRLAAEIYGCEVLRENIEDRADNETRFVWLAQSTRASEPPLTAQDTNAAAVKTSLVFWGRARPARAGWCAAWMSSHAVR